MIHQVNDRQCVRGGHIWPCPPDSLSSKHGLAQVVSTSCQGILKGLPDDVLKVAAHTYPSKP